MKPSPRLKYLSAASIIAILVWIFWPATQVRQQMPANKIIVKNKSVEFIHQAEKPVVKKSPVAVIPEKISSNDSATLVAKAYAAELSFPAYSQPLSDNDVDRLEPNYFNPQSIPVDDNGATISATLSKYRYTYPEPVLATLNGENIDSAQLQLIDTTSGKILLTRHFTQDDSQWLAEFDGERNLPMQLQARVTAQVNGKNVTLALALKYVDSVATLEGFEPAFNQDADMVLQANLTTHEQGLYRVRANLFDANHQPIAHLVSKEKLNKGSSSIELKAHQSVLQGRQAPFYLATFSIERMSPAPGKPTKYGDSAINQYEIKNFAVSSLSDTPYQPSAQEQQRLKLLQNMAQGG
ncbi:MAG: hypothetical protein ACPG52_01950 [Cognaticolwellia sp.]